MKISSMGDPNKIKLASMFLIIGLMAGCSTISEDEFLCPEPESGVCVDSKTAYEAAERGVTNAEEYNAKKISVKGSEHGNQLDNVAPVVGTMSEPIRQPKPILMPAKVLRVWINAYEDNAGALHMPQVSFVEVTPRRWSLENVKAENHKVLSPFKVVTSQISTEGNRNN